MSLPPSPHSIPPVPPQTVAVAHAAFPKGNNLYLKMRDELGTFFEDQQFAPLFPKRGHQAEHPWRLALVTIFQFVENLSDRAAAEAVCSRIDWKYALSLELTDSGFDYSVLSKFRHRLIEGQAEPQLLETMLQRFKEKGLVKARGTQRTDSTHILAAVRKLNRTAQLGETVRAALNQIAAVAPSWLKDLAGGEWYERYSRSFEDTAVLVGETKLPQLIQTFGRDGITLLKAIYTDKEWNWLGRLSAVEVLRQTWVQQFYFDEDQQIQLRELKNQPPASERINSPYDPQSTYATKRQMGWSGYKVQLTESCEEGEVHLITDVQTTRAGTGDAVMVEPIHQSLATKQLLPTTHLVDSGYVGGMQLVMSREKYKVELLGPLRPNGHWQSQTHSGFALSDFKIDWENQKVTCPQGQSSHLWKQTVDTRGQPVIHVDFHQRYCRPCPSRALCTKAKYEPREITLRPKEQHLALEQRRVEQETAEWQSQYQRRAGIEGTISQGVRGFGLRQTRYKGLARTHLQNLAIAAALNLERAVNFLLGRPSEQSRTSRFAALALAG